jgi:hypothetical protein
MVVSQYDHSISAGGNNGITNLDSVPNRALSEAMRKSSDDQVASAFTDSCSGYSGCLFAKLAAFLLISQHLLMRYTEHDTPNRGGTLSTNNLAQFVNDLLQFFSGGIGGRRAVGQLLVYLRCYSDGG